MPKIMLNGVNYSAPSASGGANKDIYGDTFVSKGRNSGTTVGIGSFVFANGATASGTNAVVLGTDGGGATGEGAVLLGGYHVSASGLHAMVLGGNGCNSSGNYAAILEGLENEASGIRALVLGGEYNTASAECAAVLGGHSNRASNFSAVSLGKYNKDMTGGGNYNNQIGDVFVVGNGASNSNMSNALRVTYLGDILGTKAFQSSGADYAEFKKEWADGNPYNEDRVGYMVTIKNGLLYKANDGDYIVGITSGNPSVVGNADEDYYWRYERDEFNRIVMEDVPEQVQATDEDGNLLFDEETREPVMVETGKIIKNARMKLADGYDPSLQNGYIPRAERKEWDYVGQVGTIPVRDDGTCLPDHFCKCGQDGIATLAEERGFDTFYVAERISDNVISVELGKC